MFVRHLQSKAGTQTVRCTERGFTPCIEILGEVPFRETVDRERTVVSN
jgi:hypothetical protein